MCVRQVRGAVTSISAVLVLLGLPAQSYALFDWLCPPRYCYPGTAVTTYTPPFRGGPVGWAPRYNAPPWGPAVPVFAPAAAPAATTCCYVPTALYRTKYRVVPTAACQAVSYWAPSSGCSMVTYRPVTAWAYRPQVVPYGASRIVYSAPRASCATVLSPACGVSVPASVSRSGCASCGQSVPASNVISPIPSSSSTVLPPPSLPGPVPTTSQPATGAPWQGGTSRYWPSPENGSLSTSSGSSTTAPTQPSSTPGSSTFPSTSSGPAAPEVRPGPIKTFEQDSQPSPQERLKPTPDSNTGSEPGKMPALGSPQGRTAQRTVFRPAVYVQPVSSRSQPGPPVPPRLDTSGWEAAGD